MDIQIANSMAAYIDTLYYMNKNLLKLCGMNAYYNNMYEYQKLTLDIIQDIPRLIPYSFDNTKQKIYLVRKDGLLEFKNKIPYLESDYREILLSCEKSLNNLRIIRNKYEHKMHNIKFKSSFSGNTELLEINFIIADSTIKVSTQELIIIIKKLNLLFSKIIIDIKKLAHATEKDNTPYYEFLQKSQFKDFNEIFESNLLIKIGKIMSNS